MRKVGAYEAKTHLAALLKEVAEGKRISITRKGVPVAMAETSRDGYLLPLGENARQRHVHERAAAAAASFVSSGSPYGRLNPFALLVW